MFIALSVCMCFLNFICLPLIIGTRPFLWWLQLGLRRRHIQNRGRAGSRFFALFLPLSHTIWLSKACRQHGPQRLFVHGGGEWGGSNPSQPAAINSTYESTGGGKIRWSFQQFASPLYFATVTRISCAINSLPTPQDSFASLLPSPFTSLVR